MYTSITQYRNAEFRLAEAKEDQINIYESSGMFMSLTVDEAENLADCLNERIFQIKQQREEEKLQEKR